MLLSTDGTMDDIVKAHSSGIDGKACTSTEEEHKTENQFST